MGKSHHLAPYSPMPSANPATASPQTVSKILKNSVYQTLKAVLNTVIDFSVT